MIRIEKTFRLKFPLQGLELRLEETLSSGLDQLDHQLILSSRFIDTDQAVGLNLHPVGNRNPGLRSIRSGEHHASDLGTVILQREVMVPRRLFPIV
jgi:hypothetical protein